MPRIGRVSAAVPSIPQSRDGVVPDAQASAPAPQAAVDSFEDGGRIGLNDALEYQTPDTIGAQLAQDKASGAGEVRLAIYVDPSTGQVLDPANNMQPLPDGIAHYDAQFKAAQQAGMPLSVCIIPDHDSLFSAMNAGQAASYGQEYAQQAGQIASHLSQFGVKDFELGNEPNDAGSWPINYSDKETAAAQYMALEAPAYDAVKGALGGDSHVVMAGLSMDDGDYLQALYDHGLAGHTDAVNIHPYDMGDTPDQITSNLNAMHDVMVRNGDSQTPVWLTELGEQSGDVGDAGQAQYVQTALSNLPDYVQKAFWFNMNDFPGASYGLETADGTQKPAFAAFQQEATSVNAQPLPPIGNSQAVDPACASVYSDYGSKLGAPTGPAFHEDNGNLKQTFANGYALLSPDGSLYVRSLDNQDLQAPTSADPFEAALGQYGAQLGQPTSGVFGEANGNLKQTFQDGYILRAPDGSMYVRDNANNDLTAPVPSAPSAPSDSPPAPAGDEPDPFGAQRAFYAPELGAQTSDVFTEDNGNLKQTFANGYLLQSPDGTVYVREDSGSQLWQSSAVDPAFMDAYHAHQTALGAPAGDASTEDSGNLKQVFDGGYILQSPDGTLDVRSLSNTGL